MATSVSQLLGLAFFGRLGVNVVQLDHRSCTRAGYDVRIGCSDVLVEGLAGVVLLVAIILTCPSSVIPIVFNCNIDALVIIIIHCLLYESLLYFE